MLVMISLNLVHLHCIGDALHRARRNHHHHVRRGQLGSALPLETSYYCTTDCNSLVAVADVSVAANSTPLTTTQGVASCVDTSIAPIPTSTSLLPDTPDPTSVSTAQPRSDDTHLQHGSYPGGVYQNPHRYSPKSPCNSTHPHTQQSLLHQKQSLQQKQQHLHHLHPLHANHGHLKGMSTDSTVASLAAERRISALERDKTVLEARLRAMEIHSAFLESL
ncbi:hypothetical protein BASA62_003778 [Batrachochytrium salamandrivorans]|nr:hypothetical protein BASA62_003778 [Batrachochytrium salamandrivorans]